jgi:hypothetical protein
MKLYAGLGAGSADKAKLMLRLLDVPCQPVGISIPEGERRNPEFLKIGPFGQILVLVDGELVISDSQAVLACLATAYGGADAEAWFPRRAAPRAAVVRWISVAANEMSSRRRGSGRCRASRTCHRCRSCRRRVRLKPETAASVPECCYSDIVYERPSTICCSFRCAGMWSIADDDTRPFSRCGRRPGVRRWRCAVAH